MRQNRQVLLADTLIESYHRKCQVCKTLTEKRRLNEMIKSNNEKKKCTLFATSLNKHAIRTT